MRRIFLIGYMGAGKTTLGVALAQELGMEFIDMDWYIEQRYHKTVRELFVERGEDGFRMIEQHVLREIGEFENVIVATGGGAPCFYNNMDYMNQMGETVFLDVTTEVLFLRLREAKQTRPILMNKTDEQLKDFIHVALQQRMPFYSQARHHFRADNLEDKTQITRSVAAFRKLLCI